MAIRNICVNDYRKILGRDREEHGRLADIIRNKISAILGELKADTVDVYNMGGVRHSHNAGRKEQRLVIFLNATFTQEVDKDDIELESAKTIDGISNNHKIFLPSKGNVGYIIKSEEGVEIAEWNKETWELNILFDLFNEEETNNVRIFEKILRRFKEEVIEQMERENSWKYTSDKKALTRYLMDSLKRSNDRQIQEDRNVVKNLEDSINSYKREIKSKYDQLIRRRRSLEAGEENLKNLSDNLIKDLDLIVQNEKVRDFHIKDNIFTLFTNDIYITSDKGVRYYGGKYKVDINIENTDIRIFGDNPRQGFWTRRDPHPHVNGSSGMPCLGNVASTIAELCSQTQLYALTLVCIDYLESANTSDPAGKNVINWDAIDEEGKIISEEDRTDNLHVCPCCGDSFDEDDLYDVYERVEYGDEEDDEDYELYGHHRVCENCRSNNYHYDDVCDEYIED